MKGGIKMEIETIHEKPKQLEWKDKHSSLYVVLGFKNYLTKGSQCMLWRLYPEGIGKLIRVYYNITDSVNDKHETKPIEKDVEYLTGLSKHVQILYVNNITLGDLLKILGFDESDPEDSIVFESTGQKDSYQDPKAKGN